MFSSLRKKSKPKRSQPSTSSSRKPKHEGEPPEIVQTSFLFTVAELHVNDDPNNGGVVQRVNGDGRWIPPVLSNGFYPANPRQIYRWRQGAISDYGRGQLLDDSFWVDSTEVLLEQYRASSTFWCNEFDQFLTSSGDASRRNIGYDPEPDNRWWPLNFRHENAISRVDQVGELHITGTGPAWIRDLGLETYRDNDPNVPPAAGLTGNLAILIGIIAFTCLENQLYQVLVDDHAWRRNHWRGGVSAGRVCERGILVTIYYDPSNEEGSNENTLSFLEWDSVEPLIH